MSHIHLRPGSSLSLKDPEATELGRSMLSEGLFLMNTLGLESFTFKKLAEHIGCTEVSLYKYFPNKHRLLQYYFQLYWLWLRQVMWSPRGTGPFTAWCPGAGGGDHLRGMAEGIATIAIGPTYVAFAGDQ